MSDPRLNEGIEDRDALGDGDRDDGDHCDFEDVVHGKLLEVEGFPNRSAV
jgi:hypothetical protein